MSGKATRAANRRSGSLKIAEDSSVSLPGFAALPTLSRTHLERYGDEGLQGALGPIVHAPLTQLTFCVEGIQPADITVYEQL